VDAGLFGLAPPDSISESTVDNFNYNQSTYSPVSNFNFNNFDFSFSDFNTQPINNTTNTIHEKDFDMLDLSNFDLDQYFAESSTQVQSNNTLFSNPNNNTNYESVINDNINFQHDDFKILEDYELLNNIVSLPPLPFSPHPLPDNIFPSFNEPIPSSDCAKDIDEFNDLLLSLISTDDQPLDNNTTSISNPQLENNFPQTYHAQFNESSNKLQCNLINNGSNDQPSNKHSKSLFDELRDLIPVISISKSEVTNQIIPNCPKNIPNQFISTKTELSKLDKKLYRQKAIARYRKKKLNRLNSTNQIQNRMYVRRQAVAFRRPRSNGRFLGLQTHFISANQFSSSSSI